MLKSIASLALLLAASTLQTTTAQIVVGSYLDAQCTQLNTDLSPNGLTASSNGACLTNPGNSGQSTRVTCDSLTSSSKWKFQAWLNGDCSGPALFSSTDGSDQCLNVVGNYIKASCEGAGVATASTTTSSTTTTTATNTTNPTLPHLLVIALPLTNLTQLYTISALVAQYGQIANITQFTNWYAASNLTSVNTSSSNNVITQLRQNNVIYSLYTDNATISDSLLFDQLPLLNVTQAQAYSPVKLGVYSTSQLPIDEVTGRLPTVGFYNSSALTVETVAPFLLSLYNSTAAANLTSLLVFVPSANVNTTGLRLPVVEIGYGVAKSNITTVYTQANVATIIEQAAGLPSASVSSTSMSLRAHGRRVSSMVRQIMNMQ